MDEEFSLDGEKVRKRKSNIFTVIKFSEHNVAQVTLVETRWLELMIHTLLLKILRFLKEEKNYSKILIRRNGHQLTLKWEASSELVITYLAFCSRFHLLYSRIEGVVDHRRGSISRKERKAW